MAETVDKKQTKLTMQMREILGNAYAFVRSRQYTETVANLTYEELLDAAIDRIEGTKGSGSKRATLLDRVKKLKAEVGQAVTTVKKQPPSYWRLKSDERVNAEDAQNTEE